jgi:S1-C subfamily serine protease
VDGKIANDSAKDQVVPKGETENKFKNAAEIFSQASPGVVLVKRQEYLLGFIPTLNLTYGTGFFVSSDAPHSCEIATVANVTESSRSVQVTTHDGQEYSAVVEKNDRAHGLAFYKLKGVQDPDRTCKELVIGDDKQEPYQPVLAIGAARLGTFWSYRSAQKPEFNTGATMGFIDQIYSVDALRPGEDFYRPVFRASNLGGPGYWGAPWLNTKGEVIAIFSSGSERRSYGEMTKFLKEDLAAIRGESKENK